MYVPFGTNFFQRNSGRRTDILRGQANERFWLEDAITTTITTPSQHSNQTDQDKPGTFPDSNEQTNE